MLYRSPRDIRLHLKTPDMPGVSRAFHDASAAYRKVQGVPRLNPDLKGRVRKNIDSARALAGQLAEGRFDKLKRALVVADNKVARWGDFVVLQDHDPNRRNNDRIADLVSRLQHKRHGEVFCALEISTGKSLVASRGKPTLYFDRIPIRPDREGKSRVVVPRVRMNYDRLDNYYFSHAFEDAGGYLIMGRPSIALDDDRGEPVYHVTFDLDNLDMVTRFSYREILASGRAEDHRRATRPWLKPYQFGH